MSPASLRLLAGLADTRGGKSTKSLDLRTIFLIFLFSVFYWLSIVYFIFFAHFLLTFAHFLLIL
jgi:hypothetical protein